MLKQILNNGATEALGIHSKENMNDRVCVHENTNHLEKGASS